MSMVFSPEGDRQDLLRRAQAGLCGNCRAVYGSKSAPVLNEGGVYTGIWLECGPQESMTLLPEAPEIAKASHRIFYALQRSDGQLPAYVLGDRVGYGQIQQVAPIARTALEVALFTGDEAFLRESFAACAAWEGWLALHRDPGKLDLLEAWCEFDTGHDNSPRWTGYPHDCPGGEAAVRPEAFPGPRLAPDLSATLYGMRRALAEMARLLGKRSEAERFRDAAERTRRAIEQYCFDPERCFYYDRAVGGGLVRIMGDAGLRVLGELVPSQALAEEIFRRHILNPERFRTPYPLPSIAADDPAFVHGAVLNNWGGASQALTALRAPRWFEHYGFFAELDDLMARWLGALAAADNFMQQMDPFTGEFSTSPGYSPAMCVAVDFLSRRHGVLETADGVWWGCRCPEDGGAASFAVRLANGADARIEHASGISRGLLDGREIFRSAAPERIFTDRDGCVLRRIALEPEPCRSLIA